MPVTQCYSVTMEKYVIPNWNAADTINFSHANLSPNLMCAPKAPSLLPPPLSPD